MEPGQSYHIFNHANGAENLFREVENYRFFLKQYAKYLEKVIDTYAYCLMPFHLLIGVREDLSGFKNLTGLTGHPSKNPAVKGFSDFFNSYTKAMNNRFHRKGNLFNRAFKKTPILSEQQWQETFLYIHLNPVKHGFVENHSNWKWTSWGAYEYLDRPSKINREYYLNFFDDWVHVENMIEGKKEWLMRRDLE
ncbi:transposase [Cyclobacterium xiamenense]|uniref:transposase n=1 Tax=Cyclobacterium xiamenense TaxID=1297121 RepID=UPI0035CF97C0